MRFILTVLFCAISIASFSQIRPSNIQPLAYPTLDAQTPDWSAEMYSESPNVNLVDQLYLDYFKTRPFKKTIDTRNYKHWRRELAKNDMVQNDGSIMVPTFEEKEAKIKFWLDKKAEFDQPTAERGGSPTSTWQQIGPYNTVGTSATYEVHQSCQVAFGQCLGNLNVLYTVSQNGQIFKTTDHGTTWFVIGENYFFDGSTFTEQCITVHPTNPDIVYYGSGTKIWKTIDGGITWTTIYTLADMEPNCIIIDPVTPQNLLISTEKGILRSTNSGTSFTTVRTGFAWDLRYKTNDPNTVFAICRNGTKSDFYKSTDGGVTWAASISGWFSDPQNEDKGGRMTVSTGNPNLIYCFVLGVVTGDLAAKPIVGIAKSIDAGATWTLPVTYNNTKGINGGQGYYDLDIEVSDADDNLVFLGTQSHHKTTDGFATVINDAIPNLHADLQELHFNGPNDLWFCTDGGMDLGNTTLTTVVPKSAGITGTEFWGFDQGWNEDSHVGGCYHNGENGYRPSYPNQTFRHFGGGEFPTGHLSIGDPAKSWYSYPGGVIMPANIMDPTTTFDYAKFPNEHSSDPRKRSEVAPHPDYFNTHFVGRENVLWKTTNGGISFTPLHTFGTNPASFINGIEISRSNPLVMYLYQIIESAGAYVGGKLWKTTDGGATFTELTLPGTASDAGSGALITLDAQNADIIWIAYARTTTSTKVFKSTNGGGAWTNLTTSLLTNLKPQAILNIGGTNGGIYLMVSHTVFYRNNTMSDWAPFGSGFPAKLDCNYLKPFYKEGKLRLASAARGLWGVDFYETPSTPIAQPTVDKMISDCWRDTFYFDDYSMLKHAGATWQWSFSPAPQYISSTAARNPKVVFGTAGNYTVTLTVTEASGASSTKAITNMVTVNAYSVCSPDTTQNTAVSFSGNGMDRAVSQLPITIGNNTDFSVSFWMKTSSTATDQSAIMGTKDVSTSAGTTSRKGFDFVMTLAKLVYFEVGDGTVGKRITSSVALNDGKWHHYEGTVDEDGVMTFYIDGVSQGTPQSMTGIASVNNGTPLYIATDILGDFPFTGEIDEVKIWISVQTQAEVREKRHLTAYQSQDLSLVSYYQFNNTTTGATELDRVGFNNLTLEGGAASRIASTSPFYGGVSQRLSVSTSNSTAVFDQPKLSIAFGSVVPNGEICVSRLNGAPIALPTNYEAVGNRYWLVNNYGTTNTALSVTSMVFSGFNVNSAVPSRYKLYKRASNANLQSDWVFVDDADAVTLGTNGSVTFSTSLNMTSFSQFVILEKGVRVSAKVLLQGAYSTTTGLMTENLRTLNLLPTNEPHTALTFPQAEGGGEATRASVFQITGNDAIVDWIFLELRDKNAPSTRLFTRSALLQRDGDVVDLDGISAVHFSHAPADDYYFAVRHRNHLGVRSLSLLSLTENTTLIDFTTSLNTLYKPVGHPNEVATTFSNTKIGLWAANSNGDNSVKMIGAFPSSNDYLKLLNTLGSSTAIQTNVYSQQDLNMDGSVKMLGAFPTSNDYLRLLNVLGSSTNTIQQGY
jgi:photosystem II stability/assembly factor-like uncharacterized protein